jgi:hypothetical protein
MDVLYLDALRPAPDAEQPEQGAQPLILCDLCGRPIAGGILALHRFCPARRPAAPIIALSRSRPRKKRARYVSLDAQDSAEADDWLASWYAEAEADLADLLERIEQEGPSLDALLAEAEQDTRALLADLAADVCPCCGQPLPKADQKPTRSAQNRGKSGVKAG